MPRYRIVKELDTLDNHYYYYVHIKKWWSLMWTRRGSFHTDYESAVKYVEHIRNPVLYDSRSRDSVAPRDAVMGEVAELSKHITEQHPNARPLLPDGYTIDDKYVLSCNGCLIPEHASLHLIHHFLFEWQHRHWQDDHGKDHRNRVEKIQSELRLIGRELELES